MGDTMSRSVAAALVGTVILVIGLTSGASPIFWLTVIAGIAFLAYRDFKLGR